jgi:glucokinase
MPSSEITIGIDIGGTRIKAVAMTAAGEVAHRQIVATLDDVATLVHTVGEIVGKLGSEQAAIGISAPGLAARDNRSIAWMRGRMQAVESLDWSAQLDREVLVLNDAHAATLAEVWIGAARNAENAILLTLGTGVGGGAIVDGKLLQGAIGRAGHLGHITLDTDGPLDIVGTPGSLEDCLGNHTLFERSNGRFSSTAELVRAVEQGDDDARAVWLRSLRGLAVGIASLINAFDPEVVILGGGIAECGETLFGPLRQYLDEFEWRPTGERVPLVAAQLGDLAGAIGAARFAAQHRAEAREKEVLL